MKTLIIGAGPLGSLYSCLFHKAGKDITILARNEHFKFIKENGVVLFNEFTQEKIVEKVKVIESLNENDPYDLAIILMRKNKIESLLPVLAKNKKISNFLFMCNNASGFDLFLDYLPKDKILFGFPGGGGSRINHMVHYIDSEKPNGKRMPVTIGEIDGQPRERTEQIISLFSSSFVPVKIVKDIDAWLKYHVALINPVAGAILKCGDNYKLAKDKDTLRTYVRSVKEGGNVLKALGYKKRYPFKFNLFYWNPESLLIKIMQQLFDSRFSEIAMMMHVNAAKDEMYELAGEFRILRDRTSIKTPNLDELHSHISLK